MAVGTAGLVGAACASGHTSAGAGASYVAAPVPRFAQTVVLKPVSGKVLIRVPGGPSGFTRVDRRRAWSRSEPWSTPTAGRVALTSATPAPTHFQSGQFFLGTFQVKQTRAGRGAGQPRAPRQPDALGVRRRRRRTPPRSASGSSGSCGAAPRATSGPTGRFSAATVRGTNWGVRDRCDGTLTVVRTGVVVVRDFRLHKNVIVRAGQTYLAKAP